MREPCQKARAVWEVGSACVKGEKASADLGAAFDSGFPSGGIDEIGVCAIFFALSADESSLDLCYGADRGGKVLLRRQEYLKALR